MVEKTYEKEAGDGTFKTTTMRQLVNQIDVYPNLLLSGNPAAGTNPTKDVDPSVRQMSLLSCYHACWLN